ncbi:hypothetical protein LZ554_006278 [Drepanopeziza brunnea f. sp. 'monogermtubi']|nr:hypothetical protein LZ554_006278 [Drepanopeziza brunnea f. sp. 'monogermtubi']
MPYIPHTPESILQRSDSKDPGTTCRGLGQNGKPCRRGIGKSPQASPSPSPRRKLSASPATASTPVPEGYCWQHKDQAAAYASSSPQRVQPATRIQERTSVDTLVDRLGLLEVEERKHGKRRKPLLVPEPEQTSAEDAPRPERQRPRPKPATSGLGLCCCLGLADEGRRAPRPARPASNYPGKSTASVPPKVAKVSSSIPPKTHRPAFNRDPSSRTGDFLSLIPPSASPQLTAQLLAEMAKPVSDKDQEGYIYMFWLTPESVPVEPPSERAASSLLAPPSQRMPGQRRTSEILNTFATTIPNSANQKTILLKIGRAQNVYRRLNQWTKQCGYNISLVRYYPYQSTTSQTSVDEPPSTPRKVPNANKVERLIHIELSHLRVVGDGKCKACGREHREWFEVDASRNGVKAVDEVIRRWVEWGERDIGR